MFGGSGQVGWGGIVPVIELRWEDLARLGGWGVGSIVPSWNFVETPHSLSLSCFLALAFLRHRRSQTHIDTYTQAQGIRAEGVGRSGQGGCGGDSSVTKGLQSTLTIYGT